MIQISYQNINGSCVLYRELTDEEKKSVTSELTNGSTMIKTFYQGDEPEVTIVESEDKSDLIKALESASPEDLKKAAEILKQFI